MPCIPYTLVPAGDGWRLGARGFTWYFEFRHEAIAFALATASDFTEATGQTTSVRVQGDDGDIRELRGFDGRARGLDPLLAMFRGAAY